MYKMKTVMLKKLLRKQVIRVKDQTEIDHNKLGNSELKKAWRDRLKTGNIEVKLKEKQILFLIRELFPTKETKR